MKPWDIDLYLFSDEEKNDRKIEITPLSEKMANLLEWAKTEGVIMPKCEYPAYFGK